MAPNAATADDAAWEAPHMSATPPSGPDDRGDVPGRIMSGEMAEQPAMLRRILDQGAPRIARWPPGSLPENRASSC